VAEPASALIFIPTGVGGGLGQQLQLHGGQVAPAGQAGQAQAQPPPEPLPPSDVTTGCIFAQTPLGQGVVKQAIPSDVHPHWSAVSATHDFASL
jgi:predicted NBD/HSP70 family sugar kinase